MAAFPIERWLIIEDNLSIPISKQTKLALAAWPEMQLQFTLDCTALKSKYSVRQDVKGPEMQDQRPAL